MTGNHKFALKFFSMLKFRFYFCIFLFAVEFAAKVVSQILPPTIVPNEDPLVVTAGTSWTITCFGRRPLDWIVKSGENEKNLKGVDDLLGTNYYSSVLTIDNSMYNDTGQYKCRFVNYSNEENSSVSINVFVFDPEHFFLPMERHYFLYEMSPQAVLPCIVTHPNISVSLLKGRVLVDQVRMKNVSYDSSRGFIFVYPTNYFDGSFYCEGRFNRSVAKKTGRILVKWEGHVKNIPIPQISVVGRRILTYDNFSVTCKVIINVRELRNVATHWYYPNPKRQKEKVRCVSTEIPGNETHNICHTSVNITFAKPEDAGNYTCSITANSYIDMRNSIVVEIIRKTKPVISDSNLQESDIHVTKGIDVNLTCVGKGIPNPRTLWYKDNSILNSTTPGIMILSNDTQLIISRVTEDNKGRYSCLVVNSEGNVSEVVDLFIDEPTGAESNFNDEVNDNIVWVVSSTFGLLALGVVAIFMYRKRRRYRKFAALQKMLFEQGDVSRLDPDAPLADQIELLPYDRQWEFCPNKLKLGKTLGQGAFGRVVKAKAYGLLSDENEPIIVAIKLLKERSDPSQQKALLQELKIMIHLGRHVNVLNLLGACTKRIDKGELMVIVEYCSRGNLRHFLLNHRDVFINQVDPQTENFINGGSFLFILDEDSSSSLQNYKNASLVPLLKNLSHGDINAGRNSQKTDQISTTDLLCLAWQIARGMEYISSKQLLHRDLAARNILLTKDYVVKICDFGLAKDLYNYSVYKKKANGPLPIKWMAIESLRDKIFSTQSDVWSFGIVLWELFTLGGNPYPGLEIDQDFFQKLLDGYRLSKPDFASKDTYLAMRECWNEKPNDRPNFAQMVTTIENLLDEKLNVRYANFEGVYQCESTGNTSDVTQDYILMSEIGDSPFEMEHLDSNGDSELPTNDRSNYLEMDNLRPEDKAVSSSKRISDENNFTVV